MESKASEQKLASHPSGIEDIDPWVAWAYKPHTITALFAGVFALVYASGTLNTAEQNLDPVSNVKRGLCGMVAVYLGYSLLRAPDTLLIRPHPALWRLVHGAAIVYLVVLTFTLFQTADDARQFLKYLYPELGVDLHERAYGADCRIYTPEQANTFKNVYDTLFDEFVIAHILGWYCKAITLRSMGLIWTLSIGFELMEVTFNHMLPNFNECWWDALILDILVCNWLGIWAGMKTVKYFEGKTYTWVGISKQPTLSGKVKRSLSQFTPASWDKDTIDPLSGPKQFVLSTLLVLVFLTVEVNAFFLKFELWVPPRNPLNTYRLLLWWLIANPAVREFNVFVQARGDVSKVGPFCWLALANVLLETLVCFKFGQGMFHKPMPFYVKAGWTTAAVVYVIFVSSWAWRDYCRYQKSSKERKEQ
eukprot:TRINITY_DN3040_c0_g1_i1.p1 TRINITY_DN3040_c0_g1~~TRINITY_DN3040_c0_g1_i1.p1  ORF type:complete len:419 (+),score=83.51 TRINITY_DN3040_c0_g1_i1:171-1427(+)